MGNGATQYDQRPPRVFLFLQGPHGPFFHQLACALRDTGAEAWRIGFNAGDRAFWRHPVSYVPFDRPQCDWPEFFEQTALDKGVTDLVLYGDVRPIHAQAIRCAQAAGIRVHVFEEGYMRPYWVSYEHGGANGNSRLMHMPVTRMREVLDRRDHDAALPPSHWGDTRQHVFYGALYHWFVMFRNGPYRHFTPHRELTVGREFWLYLRRLILMPFHSLERRLATRRITLGGFPYHLCLLQLEHDSAFQQHSPFTRQSEFLEIVLKGFAQGAPAHHHLVFKAHPLENGRTNMRRVLRQLTRQYGVEKRVHYVRGGKLARLLDHARSAVTVNSTAGQQVLWRGLPLKTFGDAVYGKPELVSTQDVAAFFASPDRPIRSAYAVYRRYLLETSQVPGGFYSAKGRRALMRHVVDMMLCDTDPYDSLLSGTASPRQQLAAVR